MPNYPSPLVAPTLRDDLPTYPRGDQALRITGATVPGPSGYGSSSVLGPVLYVAFTQQLRTDTVLPRDREPCLVLDLNGLGLSPGYYLGRLAGSYASLPVYEVGGGSGLSAVSLPGLTSTELNALTINLSPAQISTLSNLNACQLQTFLTLTVSQQQILTGSLTPAQLGNLVGFLTPAQLGNLLTTINVNQLQYLTTTYNSIQIEQLLQLITAGQLTLAQLGIYLTTLTPTQLLALVVPVLQDFTGVVPQWKKFVLNVVPPNFHLTLPDGTGADFALNNSTTQTITIETPALGTVISVAGALVDVAFTGGGITNLTGNIGDDGSPTRYISALAMRAGLSTVPQFSASVSNATVYYSGGNTKTQIVLTSTGANMNALTAGQITIQFLEALPSTW